uniref:Uncharacterized protein n=1 Tax=Chromera velia CCMP2878 TaxID=1169474 RepID=A0A0G4F980_9ALVE|eukprot:Cvel_15690.t1-p1 / transcript=Cvel_15690.t1 / gene=Cvel_15690 / organism=Chromera_velia_CCMP2878 / gene_product=CDK5 regulatory subunit-associated protein 2, putative / transcript_product=CDK5 regulatory subunit-associated protein 2, putative / location=Cvel_scaffold1171:20833-25019(+) / protein_length=1237 / sequence_SO=supercontig / SO=protein_coding / is_pseudo=false
MEKVSLEGLDSLSGLLSLHESSKSLLEKDIKRPIPWIVAEDSLASLSGLVCETSNGFFCGWVANGNNSVRQPLLKLMALCRSHNLMCLAFCREDLEQDIHTVTVQCGREDQKMPPAESKRDSWEKAQTSAIELCIHFIETLLGMPPKQSKEKSSREELENGQSHISPSVSPKTMTMTAREMLNAAFASSPSNRLSLSTRSTLAASASSSSSAALCTGVPRLSSRSVTDTASLSHIRGACGAATEEASDPQIRPSTSPTVPEEGGCSPKDSDADREKKPSKVTMQECKNVNEKFETGAERDDAPQKQTTKGKSSVPTAHPAEIDVFALNNAKIQNDAHHAAPNKKKGCASDTFTSAKGSVKKSNGDESEIRESPAKLKRPSSSRKPPPASSGPHTTRASASSARPPGASASTTSPLADLTREAETVEEEVQRILNRMRAERDQDNNNRANAAAEKGGEGTVLVPPAAASPVFADEHESFTVSPPPPPAEDLTPLPEDAAFLPPPPKPKKDEETPPLPSILLEENRQTPTDDANVSSGEKERENAFQPQPKKPKPPAAPLPASEYDASLPVRLRAALDQVDSLTDRCKLLEGQMKERAVTMTHLEGEVQRARRLERQTAGSIKQIQTAHASQLAEMERRFQAAKNAQLETGKEKAALQSALRKSRQQIQEVAQARDGLASRALAQEKAVKSAKEAVERAATDRAEAETEAARLSAVLAQARADSDLLSADLAEARKSCAAAQTERDRWQKKVEAAFKAQEGLQTKIRHLNATAASETALREHAERTKTDQLGLIEETAVLRAKLQRAEAALEALQKERHREKSQTVASEESALRSAAAERRAAERVTELECEVARLVAELSNAKDETRSFKTRVEETARKLSDTQSNLKNVSGKSQALTARLRREEEQHQKSAQHSRSLLRHETKERQRQIAAERTKADQALARVTRLQEALNAEKEKAADLERSLEKIKKKQQHERSPRPSKPCVSMTNKSQKHHDPEEEEESSQSPIPSRTQHKKSSFPREDLQEEDSLPPPAEIWNSTSENSLRTTAVRVPPFPPDLPTAELRQSLPIHTPARFRPLPRGPTQQRNASIGPRPRQKQTTAMLSDAEPNSLAGIRFSESASLPSTVVDPANWGLGGGARGAASSNAGGALPGGRVLKKARPLSAGHSAGGGGWKARTGGSPRVPNLLSVGGCNNWRKEAEMPAECIAPPLLVARGGGALIDRLGALRVLLDASLEDE